MNGKPILRPTPLVAMVHQSIVTFPWMNALENVMLSLKNKRLSREEVKSTAMKSLEIVGLQGFEELCQKARLPL